MELWLGASHDLGIISRLWQVAECLLAMPFKTYYRHGCSDLCVSGRLAETCEYCKANRYTEMGSDLKPWWARNMAGRQVVIHERETAKESCKLGRNLGRGAVLRCQLRLFSLLCLLQNSNKAFQWASLNERDPGTRTGLYRVWGYIALSTASASAANDNCFIEIWRSVTPRD